MIDAPLDFFRPVTGEVLATERPTQGLYFDVWLITAEQGRFILKIGRTSALIAELHDEVRILGCLQAYAPTVARPVAHTEENGIGYFLFTCIEGETLLGALLGAGAPARHALAAGYGRMLTAIHNWAPAMAHPVDWLDDQVVLARERVAQGRVPDPIRSRGQFGGAAPSDVLRELLDGAAGVEPDVCFGHGDYAVTNAIARSGQVVGAIDWSLGGYRDRRMDLAQAVKSLRWNLQDEELVDTFLTAYGYGGTKESLRWFEALQVLNT